MTGASPRVVFTVTLDDVYEGARFGLNSTIRVLRIIGVVAAVIGVAALAAGNPSIGVWALLFGLVELALVAPPVGRFLVRRRAGRLVGMVCEVTLGDTALTFRQSGFNGEFEWSALTDVREDARTVRVFSGPLLRMSIPKRAFPSEAELEAFHDEIEARIAAAATPAG
jgi:hypothetical protein